MVKKMTSEKSKLENIEYLIENGIEVEEGVIAIYNPDTADWRATMPNGEEVVILI